MVIPELTESHFAKAIPASLRLRLINGRFESGADVVALRRFVGLAQSQFADALGITVHTLCTGNRAEKSRKGRPSLSCVSRHAIRENIAAGV